MKLSLSPRGRLSLRRRLVTACAVLGASLASCATDEIVGIDYGPEAGTTVPQGADAGLGSPLCGNGRLDDREGCDDGNRTSGDGCSATCTVESAGAGGCPGTAITLGAPSASVRTGHISGDTASSGSSFQSATCGGGNGKDAVYSITSDLPGRARVRLEAGFDSFVALRSICLDATTEATCKAVPVGGGATEIVFPIAAKETRYVVVDGIAGKSGSFELDVRIDATTCGDARAEYPEQCDDGNTAAGDGCSPTCTLETPVSLPGKCPGASYTLFGSPAGPRTVSFAGDVSLLANTASSLGCTSGSGKDQVYAITPTISGSLKSVLRASFPAAQLHARRECFSGQSQLDCRVEPRASVPLEMTIPVQAQTTYFVFVDSASSSPGGTYTLDVTLSPESCGNGTVEPSEQCDDANAIAGDGCAATCVLEAPPAGVDTCPGAPITFSGVPGGPMSFATTASTAVLGAGVRAACGSTGTKDAVYSFVAPYDGWLDAEARGAFALALDLRSDCLLEGGAAGASLSCSDADKGNGAESVKGPIEAGKTYFLVVKGALPTTDNEGPFTLKVNVRPSVCGNGVIEGGEECDDGGTAPGDACDASCLVEDLPVPPVRTSCTTAEELPLVAGAGGAYTASVTGGNWNLPGGGSFSAPCAGAGKEAYFTVTPPIDGVLVAKTVSTYHVSLGARASCPPNTGSGYLACSDKRTPAGESISFAVQKDTTYWIIVDAPGPNDRGRFDLGVTVKSPSCGDGLVSGAEQCDDGNLVSGDGCSATCTLEALPNIDSCPGHAVSLVGAGTAPRERVVSLSTTPLTASYAGTCGGNGRDGVVAVTSDMTGTLRALLTTAWPSVLYARSICANAATELGCKEADPAKPSETTRDLSVPITAGVPVTLFVDGLSGGEGPATLRLTVTQ